eukprot:TRINITY_DN96672_c0_g1_i1.p1 TRINITY_DN96672_c0_g1~~TRINITY_DN96672_c0_g1_i1.p1  ORF type:complete len:200 (-),score=27.05 TRINITY_DN96672_c0_g1_i1:91-690(-)
MPISLSLLLLASLLLPSTAAVASARWRLVGRDVSASWAVNSIRFYSDASCSTQINAQPIRHHQGDGQRYDGSAFAGPNYVRPPAGGPADAFEDNSVTWETGVSCPSSGDVCHIGFRWLSDQVSLTGVANSFATVGVLQRGSAAPLCVKLDQSTLANNYAATVLVQYWSSTAKSWQDHTTFTGLTGGVRNLRLPEVAGAR